MNILKVVLLTTLSVSFSATANAADSRPEIPSGVRNRIKSKCVTDYPDDYSLQRGCIANQSDAYLEVHGNGTDQKTQGVDVDEIDPTGIPSAFDRAQINNAAYLSVAGDVCGVNVENMPMRYRERAIASDRLNEQDVNGMIDGAMKEVRLAVQRDKKAFCSEAKANLGVFVDDLKN